MDVSGNDDGDNRIYISERKGKEAKDGEIDDDDDADGSSDVGYGWVRKRRQKRWGHQWTGDARNASDRHTERDRV